MKVIAFNGSPRKNGNTYHMLKMVLEEVEKEGIETELVQVGGTKISPCLACMKCFTNKDKKCVQKNDIVNEMFVKMMEADAIVIGSPTYFAGVTPEIKAFMDRTFYLAIANGRVFRQKLGAAVAAERRAGAVSVVDTINHYFGISGMYSAGSRYWNLGIGRAEGEVVKDEEGVDTMRQLGQNIAFFVKKTADK